MKIAVSAANKNPQGNVADVFGRCPYFIIADVKNNEIKKVEVDL